MRIASSVFLAVLAGCASLDRDECVNADWYAIGLEDGACAKHNIAPNSERYLAGRNDGPALKEGIPNPRTRSQEIERLEALTRESEQLESRIEQLR